MGANLSVGQEHVLCFGDLCCHLRLETNFKLTGGSKGIYNTKLSGIFINIIILLAKCRLEFRRSSKAEKKPKPYE